MTHKSKIFGLAVAASVFGATSAFAAPIVNFTYVYVGSCTAATYAQWESDNVAGSADPSPAYTTVLSDPTAPANSGYVSEYDVKFNISGLATNEHWSQLGFNVTTTGGLTVKSTSGDDSGNESLWTADTATPKVWATNADNGVANDLQAIAVIASKASANNNLGASTKWGGPNVSLGFIAVQSNGTTAGTLSATPVAGSYLGTYTGQTSTATGTAALYNISTSTFSPTAVNFPAAGPTSVYKFALDNGGVAAALGAGGTSSTVTVIGNNKGYADTAGTTFTPTSKGVVTIDNANLGIGAEVPVWVLVQFSLGAPGDLATIEAAWKLAANQSGATVAGVFDSAEDTTGTFTKLTGQYPSFTGANSLLVEYTADPRTGSPDLAFGFDLTGSGDSVAGVVAVPEPASIGLLALGALGLIGRRRSSK